MTERMREKLEIWFLLDFFILSALLLGFVMLGACLSRSTKDGLLPLRSTVHSVRPGSAGMMKSIVAQPEPESGAERGMESTGAERADTDGDGDIDLEDYARMIQDFTGPAK